MPKRFTQTEKWLDPWFRELPIEYRFFWTYLCDFCDMAGIWKKDLKAASFFIGVDISSEKAIQLFNQEKERIVVFKDGNYWAIKDFCNFQYGEFNDKSPIHRRVFSVLSGFGLDSLWGRVGDRVGTTLQEEEEVKEEVKDKRIVKERRFRPPGLEDLKAAFSEKGFASSEAEKFLAYFESVGWVVGVSRKPMKSWRGAVATWCSKLRDNGVRPKVCQEKTTTPAVDVIQLSDQQRQHLIKTALPGFKRK